MRQCRKKTRGAGIATRARDRELGDSTSGGCRERPPLEIVTGDGGRTRFDEVINFFDADPVERQPFGSGPAPHAVQQC